MSITISNFAGVVLGVAFTPGPNGPPEIPSGGFIPLSLRVQRPSRRRRRRFVIGRRTSSKTKNPPGAAARRVSLPRCSKVCLVPAVMAVSMTMPAAMPAIVPGRAVVGRGAPNIRRLPAAIVAGKHALAIDPRAAGTALVRYGAGIPAMMIPGLSGGWCENGEAGGERKELEERFHVIGLVGDVWWLRYLPPHSLTRDRAAYSCARRFFPCWGMNETARASQSATLTRPPNQRNLHLT